MKEHNSYREHYNYSATIICNIKLFFFKSILIVITQALYMKHNIPSASSHLQFLVQVQYAINNINPVQFVEYSSESKYKN